jgi:ATP-dependent DNA ligase
MEGYEVEVDGEVIAELLAASRQQDPEGIVVKRTGSPYRPERPLRRLAQAAQLSAGPVRGR